MGEMDERGMGAESIRITRRGVVMGLASGLLWRPAAADTDWIVEEIAQAAATHGVDAGWLISTAECESGLRPDAVNPRTGDMGLFQFQRATWEEFCGYRGLAPHETDIWSVWWQCDMAAWAFGAGYAHRWCCSGEWTGGLCQ